MEAQVQQLTTQLAALTDAHQQAIQQLQAAQQQIAALQQAQVNAQPTATKIKPPKPPVFTGSAQPSAVNWCYLMETYLQSCDVNLNAPIHSHPSCCRFPTRFSTHLVPQPPCSRSAWSGPALEYLGGLQSCSHHALHTNLPRAHST